MGQYEGRRNLRKQEKVEEAEERFQERLKRSPEEQLKILTLRVGPEGAKKERKRLLEELVKLGWYRTVD